MPRTPKGATDADGRQYVRHNVNHRMRLRINAAGRRQWEAYYRALGMEPSPLPIDADGFVTDQTWSLMQILAPAIRMGSSPFHPEVWIEVTDE